MDDVKIETLQKTAVFSANHCGLLHDEVLKNIEVDGIQLSVIRRFKQDPDPVKFGSSVYNLSPPLLKNIMTSKSMCNKNLNLYELKEGFKKHHYRKAELMK